MFADRRTLDDGTGFSTDVCVAGAGAAGIALALAFVYTRLNVCLPESGSLEFEPETQAFYEGENAGRDYYPLDFSRLRFFGGTTNHWGGRSQPLSSWDFAERPWIPYSSWPIGLSDLERYYRRAQEICGLGPFSYDAQLWQQLEVAAPAIGRRRLRYAFWRHGWRASNARASDDASDDEPVLFGTDYRDALSRAPNVLVLLQANLTKIRLDPTGRTVEAFDPRSLTGTSARIDARRYVLACGAIENARLLLLSDDVEPEGVGKRHDLVGRSFMEHPDAKCGLVQPTGLPMTVQTFRHQRIGSRTVQPGVLLAPELQAREQVLGCATSFFGNGRIRETPRSSCGACTATSPRAVGRVISDRNWPKSSPASTTSPAASTIG